MHWRSLRARINLWLGNRIRWQRGGYRERPAGALTQLTSGQRTRIDALNKKYAAYFENSFGARNSLENYFYLDMLDHLRSTAGDSWPRHRDVIDIGSKNFYYAKVLHLALHPERLEGIELEGYRLYPDFYSRYDYAMTYTDGLPATYFTVADFRDLHQPAAVISCLYPFVFENTHINWQLPASAFDPEAYFDAIARNLKQDGNLIMINQGTDEAEHAHSLCRQRGLQKLCEYIEHTPLLPRELPSISSLWKK